MTKFVRGDAHHSTEQTVAGVAYEVSSLFLLRQRLGRGSNTVSANNSGPRCRRCRRQPMMLEIQSGGGGVNQVTTKMKFLGEGGAGFTRTTDD